MVHIYTFCDKTLVGKKDNSSAKFLCENLYKMNFRIDEVCTFCNSYDFSTINFRNKDIYFLLMQKSNATLNSYLAQLTNSELVENELLKQTVHTYHKNNNLPIDKSCELEWVIPKVCAPITNPHGKTQGFVAKLNECEIFVLPSDYEQLKRIYFDCLLEHLENNFNSEYKSETYKVFGLTAARRKRISSATGRPTGSSRRGRRCWCWIRTNSTGRTGSARPRRSPRGAPATTAKSGRRRPSSKT